MRTKHFDDLANISIPMHTIQKGQPSALSERDCHRGHRTSRSFKSDRPKKVSKIRAKPRILCLKLKGCMAETWYIPWNSFSMLRDTGLEDSVGKRVQTTAKKRQQWLQGEKETEHQNAQDLAIFVTWQALTVKSY